MVARRRCSPGAGAAADLDAVWTVVVGEPHAVRGPVHPHPDRGGGRLGGEPCRGRRRRRPNHAELTRNATGEIVESRSAISPVSTPSCCDLVAAVTVELDCSAAKPVRSRRCPATVMPPRSEWDEPGRLRFGREQRSRGRVPRGWRPLRTGPCRRSSPTSTDRRIDETYHQRPRGGIRRAARSPRDAAPPRTLPVPPTPTAGFPVTVGSVTLDKQPQKIVSLAPSLTEMLFAIDAGRQVVAVDEYSNYPSGRAEDRPVRRTSPTPRRSRSTRPTWSCSPTTPRTSSAS